MNKIKIKNKIKIQKIICREGFVEILHFEGGRILPSVGEGRVAFWGEAEPGEGYTLSMRRRKHDSFPVWGRLALHFWGRKLDSFPIKDIFVLILGEESLNPSPCGEGLWGWVAICI